jgi:hypothetical protein
MAGIAAPSAKAVLVSVKEAGGVVVVVVVVVGGVAGFLRKCPATQVKP